MYNNRLEKIVDDLANAIASALAENNVTREEYREGVMYLMKVAEAKETVLLYDVFVENLVIKNQDRRYANSPQAIQGPYFVEEVPVITDGKLKTLPQDNEVPLLIRSQVTDETGAPVEGATVFVWHSTPTGKYSKFHDEMPTEYYRGQVKTDANGRFELETTMPSPYSIPNKGPTGALLLAMGRHTMRPAHVHFKVRKDGFRDHTTQAYFQGGEWTDSDCAGGIVDGLIFATGEEAGKKVLEIDFKLDKRFTLAA